MEMVTIDVFVADRYEAYATVFRTQRAVFSSWAVSGQTSPLRLYLGTIGMSTPENSIQLGT